MNTGFWWANLKAREQLDAINSDGRVILKWILNEQDGEDVRYVHLAQDRDK